MKFLEIINALFSPLEPAGECTEKKYDAKVDDYGVVLEHTIDMSLVSEPVISFVNTVKANPRRFCLSCGERESFAPGHGHVQYTIRDKLLKHEFSCVIWDRHICPISEATLTSITPYVASYPRVVRVYYTQQHEMWSMHEVMYVYKELSRVFTERRDKLVDIAVARAVRARQRYRDKLMKDYCND